MSTQLRRFMRFPEVKNQVGLGRTAIYGMVKSGDFPKPIPIGARAVAWDSAAVDQWIVDRIAASQERA